MMKINPYLAAEHNLSAAQQTQVSYVFEQIFAPWVKDMGLQVKSMREGFAELCLADNTNLFRQPRNAHHQPTLSGQAGMAIADSALVFAVLGLAEETYHEMTTVDLTSHFLKPIFNHRMTIKVNVVQRGRRLVRGQVDIIDELGRLCLTAMVTYAFL